MCCVSAIKKYSFMFLVSMKYYEGVGPLGLILGLEALNDE